jgi:uncharacterized protein
MVKTEVIWNQLADGGTEHLILRQDAQIEAEGLVVGMLNDSAYRIQYQIVCDANWNVKKVNASNLLTHKGFALIKNGDDWLDEQNRPIESLSGCTDVDIMVTPFTNTLPIKRLNLAKGESKEIAVVYVSAPELNLSKLKQRYTYLSRNTDSEKYRYENIDSGFTSDLKIDVNGLVLDYPGIFKLMWKKIE